MTEECFPQIPKIQYEGPKSRNPLAFKFYDADEVVAGKTLRDHLRFSVAYWHTLQGTGADPFGSATMQRPWLSVAEPMEQARARMRAAFELFTKLGVS
ncbi:MAG TPA: xylose isomerase, partial [Firmicutes bacterium]|nr:xylose isomerase [Bacillota bacterium]